VLNTIGVELFTKTAPRKVLFFVVQVTLKVSNVRALFVVFIQLFGYVMVKFPLLYVVIFAEDADVWFPTFDVWFTTFVVHPAVDTLMTNATANNTVHFLNRFILPFAPFSSFFSLTKIRTIHP